MASREDLVAVFEDTKQWYETDTDLKEAVKVSKAGTKIHYENDTPRLPDVKSYDKTEITVTTSRSFEAAMRLTDQEVLD